MKSSDSLKKYFEKRTDAIAFFLNKPAKSFTFENFHKLRVDVKKLNAFFELLNFCAKDFKRKKTFKLFKIVFAQAGKVRELALEESALKKYAPYDSLKDYMNDLKTQRLMERKVFFSSLTEDFLNDVNKTYAAVVPFISHVHKKFAVEYLKKKETKIELLLRKKKLKPGEIHELRKRLKEFYYVKKCTELKTGNNLIKDADALQELLGQWHDCRVMTGHLKKAIDGGGLKESEIKVLEKIKAKVFSESEELFEKIKDVKKEC